MKLDNYYIFYITIIKFPKKFKTIWRSCYNKGGKYYNGRKYEYCKRSQNLCFKFDWSKDVDESFKREIEFIIKSNESSAENKIKNRIEQLLLEYKHGKIIHEHGKQQRE